MHEKEKNDLLSEYNIDIKYWKKQLGEVNRKNIKLQNKLDVLENLVKLHINHQADNVSLEDMA